MVGDGLLPYTYAHISRWRRIDVSGPGRAVPMLAAAYSKLGGVDEGTDGTSR